MKPKPEQGTPRYMQTNAVDRNEHNLVEEARSITRSLGLASDEAQRAWLDAADALVLSERYEEAIDRLESLSQSIDLGSTQHLLTLKLKLLRLTNRLGRYGQVAKYVHWCEEFVKQTDSFTETNSDELLKLAVYAGMQSWLAEPAHETNETASEISKKTGIKDPFAAPIVTAIIESKPYYSELRRVIFSWREHASSKQLFEEALPLVRNMKLDSDKILLTHFLALELVSFPSGSEALIAEDIRQLINFWSIASADIVDPKLFIEHESAEDSSAILNSLYNSLPTIVANSPIWTPLRAIVFLQGLSTWSVANIMKFAESQFTTTDPLRIDAAHYNAISSSLYILREIYKLDEHGKESASCHEKNHVTVEQHLNARIRQGLYEGRMGLVKSNLDLLADHFVSQDLSEKKIAEMNVLTTCYHRFNLSGEVSTEDTSTIPSSENRHVIFSDFVLAQSNLVLYQAATMTSSMDFSESDAESMNRWVLDVERKYSTTSLEYVTANYTHCCFLQRSDPKTAVKRLRKQRNALAIAGFSNNEFIMDLTLREIDALYTLGRDRECVESAESSLVKHSPVSTETECKLRIAQLRSIANMRQTNDSAIKLITSVEKNLLLSHPPISKKLEKSLRIELMRNTEILGEYSRALEFVILLYDFQSTSELDPTDVYLLTSIARLAALTSNKEIEVAAWNALSTIETPMSVVGRYILKTCR